MPNPFYNREERRVRALVRIVLHGAIFIVLVSFAVLLVSPIALAGYDAPPTSEEIAMDSAFTALATVASLVVMTFLLWLMARFVDRRDFSDYGLWITERTWARDLGFGLVLGVALQGLIFLFQWVVGWIEITGTFVASRGTFATAILLPVVIYICVGIYEEMLSRSYHLLNIAEGLNSRFIGPRAAVLIAWGLSSAVFGVLHALNPNASAISTFNIAIAGLFLGLGYILTRSLAIPVGLHISWNFAQGNIFGFPVSGTDAGATFIAIEQGGPQLWTGGAFGPEAGLIGLLTILAGMILTVLYIRAAYGTTDVQTSLAEYTPRKSKQKPAEDAATIPSDGQSTA